MKTTTITAASMSVMAASMLAIMITKIALHWEISFGDDFTAIFIAAVSPALHFVFVRWGLEPAGQPTP
jgi:hypothetical protein